MTSVAPADAQTDGWESANRSYWDGRVGADVEAARDELRRFLESHRGPVRRETTILGNVEGRRLVHLQCRLGIGTLRWARAGALVTGIDFSEPAVEIARKIAVRAGLAKQARFVVGDVRRAPALVSGERVEIVYASGATIGWLPSVAEWAEAVAGLLAPGGRLWLEAPHPVLGSLGDDGRSIESDYEGSTGIPVAAGPEGTFTWQHSLGEVLGAVLDAGLSIERFEEIPTVDRRSLPCLVAHPSDEPGEDPLDIRWGLPPGHPKVPLSFRLVARRTEGARAV